MKSNKSIQLSDSDKMNFISNFSTMFTAGIPILEIVDSLLEDAKGNTKKILTVVREDLTQGKHLYSSLAEFPRSFNKVTVNTIKASEEAGTLDVTLKDIYEQIKKDTEFKDQIKGALTYPVIIVLVFFGVMFFILTVAIPKIATVFLRLNVDLPLPTRILIFLSNVIINDTVFFIIGTVALVAAMVFGYKTKRDLILSGLYKLPVVSELIKEIDITRFARSIHLLLVSGITITNALELSEEVVLRKDIEKAISNAKDIVLSGGELSQAFKQQKNIFSGIVVRIIEAGEKTGTLDNSMQQIAEHLDYQVGKTLKTLTTLLEPLMLVFVGILIGGMMLSIIAPIYGLIGQIGSH